MAVAQAPPPNNNAILEYFNQRNEHVAAAPIDNMNITDSNNPYLTKKAVNSRFPNW